MDRYDSAYIDTFSVDRIKFRFVNPITNVGKERYDVYVYLEKQINNKWVYTDFGLSAGNHIGDFYHSKDVNGDAFIDITQNRRFVQAVYFYDPETKNFYVDTTTDDNYINPDWTLIDTARKIFCDFQDLKQMCGQIHSTLYTYKGFKQYSLYDLELYNCTETDYNTDTITKFILSKCINGNPDSLVKVDETVLKIPIVVAYDSSYFDYRKYWKERYKNLLGQ